MIDKYTKSILSFNDSYDDPCGVSWIYGGNSGPKFVDAIFGKGLAIDSGISLRTQNLEPFMFGTGDFTIEFWIYMQAWNSNYGDSCGIFSDGSSNSIISIYVHTYRSNNFYIALRDWKDNQKPDGTDVKTTTLGSTGIGLNVWYHIALVRHNGILKFFLNGELQDKTLWNADMSIPRYGDTGFSGIPRGTLSGFRISHNARWYDNFNPYKIDKNIYLAEDAIYGVTKNGFEAISNQEFNQLTDDEKSELFDSIQDIPPTIIDLYNISPFKVAHISNTPTNIAASITTTLNGNNEWKTLVTDSDINLHSDKISSWTTHTPNDKEIFRITKTKITSDSYLSNATSSVVGFRPIITIPDLSDPKQANAGSQSVPVCHLDIAPIAALAVPGQAVPCKYTASQNTVGTFSALGTSTVPDLTDRAPRDPNGTFYFVCIGYEPSGALKFVADRIIQTGISWETLNTAGYCTHSGKDASLLTGVEGSYMRIPESDVVINAQDKSSSEWDAIFFIDTVGGTEEPVSDVCNWNYAKTKSWMMNTPAITDDIGNPADMAKRIVRGQEDNSYTAVVNRGAASTFVSDQIGFRPILVIPVNNQKVFFTKEEVTPTRTSSRDVSVIHEFLFLDEEATLEETTFEYRLNGTVHYTVTPEDYVINLTIPFDDLNNGSNDFRLIVTCKEKKQTLAYTIVKEAPGDTARTRNYPHYAGGYELGSLSTATNSVAGDVSSVEYDTPASIRLPKNLTAITIVE